MIRLSFLSVSVLLRLTLFLTEGIKTMCKREIMAETMKVQNNLSVGYIFKLQLFAGVSWVNLQLIAD